jgi:hypothetical protein
VPLYVIFAHTSALAPSSAHVSRRLRLVSVIAFIAVWIFILVVITRR